MKLNRSAKKTGLRVVFFRSRGLRSWSVTHHGLLFISNCQHAGPTPIPPGGRSRLRCWLVGSRQATPSAEQPAASPNTTLRKHNFVFRIAERLKNVGDTTHNQPWITHNRAKQTNHVFKIFEKGEVHRVCIVYNSSVLFIGMLPCFARHVSQPFMLVVGATISLQPQKWHPASG